ncbi:hypothetical protein MKW92_035662 [Papaver armeniacum]|nr:hypothetical protein MKW92_035662 [Papaver armeniacum]
MASVASATHDLSRLSVSTNPPPSRKPEPIDFARLNLWGAVGFTGRRNGPNFDGSFVGDVKHRHVIRVELEVDKFTVDNGPERDMKDSENIKFLESICNYEIPEEFAEVGLHTFQVQRTCKAFEKAAAAMSVPASGMFVPNIGFEESRRFMRF